MEHIPITHAPQGAGEPSFRRTAAFPATDAPAASPIPATRSRPADAAALSSGPSRPAAYETAADMPRPDPALSPTGRHLTEPAAHGPSCHKKRPPSQGRRSFCPNGLFLPRQEQSTCACDRCPAPAGSGTEAGYFFRASESTMAWAWASSTFPASRTSTCRSAPRASTPRMGMFPAWPCIS